MLITKEGKKDETPLLHFFSFRFSFPDQVSSQSGKEKSVQKRKKKERDDLQCNKEQRNGEKEKQEKQEEKKKVSRSWFSLVVSWFVDWLGGGCYLGRSSGICMTAGLGLLLRFLDNTKGNFPGVHGSCQHG